MGCCDECDVICDVYSKGTRLQITEQLAESEHERSILMRQLDAERVDLRHMKKQLMTAKTRLIHDEQKLKKDDHELQSHLKYIKGRMQNLAELGLDSLTDRSVLTVHCVFSLSLSLSLSCR